jgi:hypothetical protein
MVVTLFEPSRIEKVQDETLHETVRQLIAMKAISEWKEILSVLYFDPASATSEFGRACTAFLRACFDRAGPALLMMFVKERGDWLVRAIDLPPNRSLKELYEQAPILGAVAPEFPEESVLVQRDFFDRVANARPNGREWLEQNVANNLVPFPPRGKR